MATESRCRARLADCPHPNPLPEGAGTDIAAHPRGQVIFHADDLGFNRAVTDGILRGFRHGLLTSASLLANAPDAGRALEGWKRLIEDHRTDALPSGELRRRLGGRQGPFDLGIHFNLTQGRPLCGGRYPAELLDDQGRFPGIFALFRRLRRGESKVRAALKEELSRQIEVSLDFGLRPTHVNGHQYVEMIPEVTEVAAELLNKYAIGVVRVPVERRLLRSTLLGGYGPHCWLLALVKRAYAGRYRRRIDRLGAAHPDVFFGTAHAGRIDMRAIRVFLNVAHAPASCSVVEIGLHPGEAAGDQPRQELLDGWHDPLALSRPNELRMLLSAELADYLESKRLCLGRLSGMRGENDEQRRTVIV